MIPFEIPKLKEKFRVNRFTLIISSILPDLIDKPFLLLGIASGRDLGHSLVFMIFSFLILHFLTKKNYSISLSYLIGIGSHLLLDLPEVPLFFPFITYHYEILDDPIGVWFYSLITDPLALATEIIGIFILVFIIINNKLYSIGAIQDYLKTIPQIPNIEKPSLLK